MVRRDFYETEMINEINDKIRFIKHVKVEFADQCLGNARSALQFAVNLFWWEKYNIKIENNRFGAPSTLFDAMNDERFTDYFTPMELSDMHLLRKTGNENLHGGNKFALEEANELLRRLEQCIKAIEKAIPMPILFQDAKTTSQPESIQEKSTDINQTRPEQCNAPTGPIDLIITNNYVNYDWNSNVFSEGGGPVGTNRKNGFMAYDVNGDFIGLVYMCDDNRSKAYGNSEIMFAKKHQNFYGRWRIIKIEKQYLPFDKLSEILSTRNECNVTVDGSRGKR